MSEITNHGEAHPPIVFNLNSREIVARLTANDRVAILDALVAAAADGRTPILRVVGGIAWGDLLRTFAGDHDPSPRLSKMFGLPASAPRSQIAAEAGVRLTTTASRAV